MQHMHILDHEAMKGYGMNKMKQNTINMLKISELANKYAF